MEYHPTHLASSPRCWGPDVPSDVVFAIKRTKVLLVVYDDLGCDGSIIVKYKQSLQQQQLTLSLILLA